MNNNFDYVSIPTGARFKVAMMSGALGAAVCVGSYKLTVGVMTRVICDMNTLLKTSFILKD